ncbi:MAG: PilZ domain-containing protein [Candidatus Omnitrophica bacterium]|nr:PilZ domain-containing protein [Candidatus Omnitrophota bacterium]
MKERRQLVRISESLRVSYQVVKSFRLVTSNSNDVSESGMRLPVLQFLQVGMKLDMEIYLGEVDKSIKAIGEVVWSKKAENFTFPFIAGIKFLKISPEAAAKLRVHIKKNSPIDHVEWVEKNIDSEGAES